MGAVELAGPFVVALVAMFLVLVLPIDSDSTLWRVGSQEVGPHELPAWLAAAAGLILGGRHMRAVHKATEDGPNEEVRVASIAGAALIGVLYGAALCAPEVATFSTVTRTFVWPIPAPSCRRPGPARSLLTVEAARVGSA